MADNESNLAKLNFMLNLLRNEVNNIGSNCDSFTSCLTQFHFLSQQFNQTINKVNVTY